MPLAAVRSVATLLLAAVRLVLGRWCEYDLAPANDDGPRLAISYVRKQARPATSGHPRQSALRDGSNLRKAPRRGCVRRIGRPSHRIDANRAAHALKYLGEMLNSLRKASCCWTSSAAGRQTHASAQPPVIERVARPSSSVRRHREQSPRCTLHGLGHHTRPMSCPASWPKYTPRAGRWQTTAVDPLL